MRATPAVGLVVAILLAGCAADMSAPPQVRSSAREVEVPAATPPVLQWRVLGQSSLVILPRTSAIDVAVPAGALTIVVNQTLESGAAYGITVSFGECFLDRPQSFVGIGQTIGADCGGLPEGTWPLQISTRAGALSAKIEPVGLFCEQTSPGWRCPAAFPPTRA